MAISLQSTEFRTDIIDGLQVMARSGKSADQMVEFVQTELGHSKEMVVPVLAYFCQAFALPLGVVLPLREWVKTHDDKEIAVLLAHLQKLREENE